MKRQKISFVLPVYNEREGIEAFWRELSWIGAALEADSFECEFIFVNDGSTDDSLSILLDISRKDRRIKVIEFSRNYGHQMAITAGLDRVTGDAAIVMDTDMQDPPRVCLEMVAAWKNGAEVVYAKRRTRKDSFMKKLTAKIFYLILGALSDTDIPQDVGDFRLLDRKAVESIRLYRERDRFMRGIAAHIGFKQKEVLFDRDERIAGVTHYPFKKMLRFSIDAIMGFSTTPLRLISKLGIITSLISIVGIIYVFVVKFTEPAKVVTGWPFVVVSIFFIGGVQLTVLGIIGGYIARIYSESQKRPLYIISAVHGIEK